VANPRRNDTADFIVYLDYPVAFTLLISRIHSYNKSPEVHRSAIRHKQLSGISLTGAHMPDIATGLIQV